jgi:glycine betaine/proline transport system ATP-binding protein
VDPDGRFRGAISRTTLLKFLDRDTPPIDPAAASAAASLAAASATSAASAAAPTLHP